MLNKILSFIFSLIIPFTNFFFASANKVLDSMSEMIFGIPYTVEAVKDEFLSEIDDDDIVAVDEDDGYVEDLVAVFIDSDLTFFEKLNLFTTTGGTLVGWSSVVDLYVIQYLPMTLDQVTAKCESLRKNDGIVFAMPVTTNKITLNSTPNDPFDMLDLTNPKWDELNPAGSNWWVEAIQARQAWDYSEYFNQINIGVVDSGFDTDHPELDGRISFPSDKQANRNYQNYHGTHVAGIIGANRNNGVGIAGICDNSKLICVDWNPELLQFWNTSLAIFFGFSEVVKAGAKVVNFSLGIAGSKTTDGNSIWDEFFASAALSIMMSSLLSKGYDFVAVQSAGNGDCFGEPMNAEYNGHFATLWEGNIITINGITKQDIMNRIIIVASADNKVNGEYVQSNFTNVGNYVSIAAPGSDIYSCSINAGYESLSGTSMAAPIVTGVASLVWSVNPDFTGAEVKDIVCKSTDSLAVINSDYDYYYDVDLMDYPMVNAKLAVEEAIRRTDSSVGTVKGKIIGANASEIEFNGNKHTLFSDGSYSFVESSLSGMATVLDDFGNEIGSFELTVVPGVETWAGDYELIPEIEDIPDEGKDDINA